MRKRYRSFLMVRRIDNKRTSRGYGKVLSIRGRGSVLLPFRERREYVYVHLLQVLLVCDGSVSKGD